MEVSFAQDSYTISEGNGSVHVCASLTGMIEREVLVQLTFEDGTAIGDINVAEIIGGKMLPLNSL